MKSIRSTNAKLVYNSKAILGEGPVWDSSKHNLLWVDIEGCMLHCHDPESNTNKQWNFKEMIGAVTIAENGDLLLALSSGLACYSLDTNSVNYLGVLENDDPKMRFNDGKCDPNGNFWIGTMHKDFVSGSGNLFKVDPFLKTSLQIKNTTISNGMAWSSDQSLFYYIDSPNHEVVAFDFDSEKSEISNKKRLFKIPSSYGAPDGMTIDNEGMLWIAHWGGSCVRRWNPLNGQVLEKVSVNAPHVTSCCFGGKDLNMLYITTARSGLSEKGLSSFPFSGGLFSIKTEVTGTPSNLFKLEK